MSAVITVATTGPIASKADNAALPTTPDEIAAEVQAAYQAGAAVAHIHLRDEAGRPTADLAIGRRSWISSPSGARSWCRCPPGSASACRSRNVNDWSNCGRGWPR
jgi:hypothetical protein